MTRKPKESKRDEEPNPNRNDAHSRLVNAAQCLVTELDAGRLFKYHPNYDHAMRRRMGTPGIPDLFGYLWLGRFVCIDVKTGKAVLTKKQRAFMETAASFGAYAIELRDLDKFRAWLQAGPASPTGKILTL